MLSSGTAAGTFEVSVGPYINHRDEAGTKNEPENFLYRFQKRVGKSILTFRTQDLVNIFFEGSGPPLRSFPLPE